MRTSHCPGLGVLLLASSLVGCTASSPQSPAGAGAPVEAPTAAPAPTPTAADALAFEATVRIDAEPGGKKLQGVWLERDDGERWIAAYRPEAWLVPFDGKRVRVTGARYTPKGQAVSSEHFRIATLEATGDGLTAGIVSVGAEVTMKGRFSEVVGEAGTKSEGERWSSFTSAGGESFALANTPEGLVTGVDVEVVARPAEYSKYAAHRGGPMIWVISIAGGPAQAKAKPTPGPYAETKADLDGDGTVEAIAIAADGAVTIGAAPPAQLTWIHPTDDYWGGLDRAQRLSVVRLDAKHQAVVFWQFQEGDVDPDKRFHVWGWWDGAIHELVASPIDVGHASEFVATGGTLRFVDDACVRDATIGPDGTPANDGQSRRTVRTLRWDAKRRRLVDGTKTTKTRSRCLIAACPFVELGAAGAPVRVGEILRRLSEPALGGAQSLNLPAFAGGRLELALVEAKPEISYVDRVELRVDGIVHRPLACRTDTGPACADDGRYLILAPGERRVFWFEIPASDDVVLVVDGYYVPQDGA